MQVQADTIKRKKMEYRKKLIIISYLSNILYTKMTCNDTLEFYHKMLMIDALNNEIQIT